MSALGTASGALGLSLAACAASAPAAPGSDASPTPALIAGLPELSLERAHALLEDPAQPATFIDANVRDLRDRGPVPGARWVKCDAVTEAELPTDRDALVVFYCANRECSASDGAAATAVELGWTNVRLMPHGIFGWRKAGYPTESTEKDHARKDG
ncbi:MAG: rhodanese-like domain-containing protein [Myxococcales bacterium]|nr:rhodanese-like domain-containing protein [Myxococcales bacterium]